MNDMPTLLQLEESIVRRVEIIDHETAARHKLEVQNAKMAALLRQFAAAGKPFMDMHESRTVDVLSPVSVTRLTVGDFQEAKRLGGEG